MKNSEEKLKNIDIELKKKEEQIKYREEQNKLEKEKYEKESKSKDEKFKLEIENSNNKYNKDLKEIKDRLKKKEEELKSEKEKYLKDLKEKDNKLKAKEEELKEKDNKLKTKEEELKKEKEKNNQLSLKAQKPNNEIIGSLLQPTSVSLSGQESVISNLLSEYLLKLNNSQYFISVFDLLNKTLINYEKLRYFNNLDQKWQEPLDNLYNFYICLKSYLQINQENAKLNDFLFQKSFKFSEIDKEDVEIIKIIKSFKLNQDINILDLYHKKKEIFLKKVGETFDILKQKILTDKSKKDFKKKNISMIDINERQKINEPKLELEINFDEILNQDFTMAKFLAYNSFSKLNELTLHISNIPSFLLYTLFVNCTDLNTLKIYFITDKSKQVNNKNIDTLNEISPMIISYLNNLESFALVDFPIKNNKLKDLIESLKLSKIKKLSLVNCFQKKDNLTPLVQYLSAPNTTATEIDLSNHTFGILNTLNNTLLNYDVNKKLTSINFSNCKLTDEDINYISNYIVASPNLFCCEISKNTLSTKACINSDIVFQNLHLWKH